MADSRKLETTKHPGIYRRHAADCAGAGRCDCNYVVRWKHRGKDRKRVFRTLALAREFKGKIDSGGDRVAPTRVTLDTYYDGWIESYRGRTVRGLEATTRDGYRTSFEQHVLPHLGRMRMRDIGSRDVADWFAALERNGVRPPTIKKSRAALSAMLATAAQEGAIAVNPCAGVRYIPSHTTVPATARKHLTVADVDRITASVDPKWTLFFELLAHTGLRVGELLGLTWQRVHLGDDAHVLITEQVYRGRRKRLKTVGSERRVPLSAGMAAALTAWREDATFSAPEDPVFASEVGTPLGYHNVYHRVLRPALRKAGIAVRVGVDAKTGDDVWDYRGVGFHAFRRACGSILLQRAGKHPKQVQGWLGHSKLTTTMNIYQHDLDDGLGGADELDAILGAAARGHRGATNHAQEPPKPDAAQTADSALGSTIPD